MTCGIRGSQLFKIIVSGSRSIPSQSIASCRSNVDLTNHPSETREIEWKQVIQDAKGLAEVE